MLPRCLGVGGGGAYHTRVPLLIGMLKLSACAGCADARAVIWGMRKALAAIAVSRGRNCSGRIFLRKKFQSSYCVLVSSVARGCPLPNPNQVRGRALGATVSDARRPRAGM